MHNRTTLQRAVFSRIRRLANFHIAFSSITQNLARYIFLLNRVYTRCTGICIAVAFRRRNWAVDVRIHVSACFFQIFSTTIYAIEKQKHVITAFSEILTTNIKLSIVNIFLNINFTAADKNLTTSKTNPSVILTKYLNIRIFALSRAVQLTLATSVLHHVQVAQRVSHFAHVFFRRFLHQRAVHPFRFLAVQ